MITLKSHSFVTLTYDRSRSIPAITGQLGKDFNRYIQRIRRLHNSRVQYIRTIELHKDNYPHIHIILQFNPPLSVTNARFYDRALYAKWKSLWTLGLSDYQPARSGRLPIFYIIKYIIKGSSTYLTLWRKLYAPTVVSSSEPSKTCSNISPSAIPSMTTKLPHFPSPSEIALTKYCKDHKLKQLSWSRNFIFPNLTTLKQPNSLV